MRQKFHLKPALAIPILMLLITLCIAGVNYGGLLLMSESTSDQYAATLGYLLHPVADLLDGYFLSGIDRPMEEELSSSPFIAYSFTTPRYPANEALVERMNSDLQRITDSSDAILGAFVYTSATDSFLASASLTASDSPFPDPSANLRDIIYNYNTGALPKSILLQSGHLSFLVRYHDLLIVTKELTPASGLAASTLFLVIRLESFSSYLFNTESLRPYAPSDIAFGIYDNASSPVYVSPGMTDDISYEIMRDSAGTDSVVRLNRFYGVSIPSESLRWKYVFAVNHGFLSPMSRSLHSGRMLLWNLIAAMLLTGAAVSLLRRMNRGADQQLRRTAQLLALDSRLLRESRSEFLRQVNDHVAQLSGENQEMRHTMSIISPEAMRMLFFRMLSGAEIDHTALEVTLRNVETGFHLQDVYAAGSVHLLDHPRLEIDQRYQIADIIQGALQKYQGGAEFSAEVLTLDMPYYAIVLSFPQDTSIARGRHVINDLIPLLQGNLARCGIAVSVSFGHLYHSIYDLPFSYHEAMRQQLTPTLLPVTRDRMDALAAVPEGESSADQEEASMDYPGFIDRRASHVVQLVLEGKQDGVPPLLDRTLATIASWDDSAPKAEYALRLVNVVTEIMSSQKNVVHDQLTDVSAQLAAKLQAGSTDAEALDLARQGILTLCGDLSGILSRQNSPYITATMEYIQAHYSDPSLSLEEIAEELKIAPNYLSSLFSKTLGQKLFDYINEYRVRQSLELLRTTRLNVNEICEKSGFGSTRNYIRVFKKITGVTPTTWRKEQLKDIVNQEENPA